MWLLATLVLGGCSGDREAMEKRVKQLEEELTRIQNSHDRIDERVTAVELNGHALATQARAEIDQESGEPARLERPPLKIVKLAPRPDPRGGEPGPVDQNGTEASEPATPEEPAGPRPVIRGRGKNVQTTSSGKGAAGGSALGQNSASPKP